MLFKSNPHVSLKSYTTKNERYPHPYATVDDIAGQKNEEKNVREEN